MIGNIVDFPPETLLQDEWSQEKQVVQLADGLRLRYVALGLPEAEPLLLLHGFTSSSRTWALVAPFLAEHYRVLIPDQRGHGDSERPLTGYPIPQLSADAVALMDVLGIEQTILVGVSMGSFVAQYLAYAYAERFSKLVLVASGIGSGQSEAGQWLHQVVNQLSHPIDPQFLEEWLANPNPVDEVFQEKVGRETAVVPVHVWQGIVNGLAANDPRTFLAEINLPTLILWGDQDPFFDQSQKDVLQSLITNNQFKRYAGGGHNIHWESPEQLAQDILNFV